MEHNHTHDFFSGRSLAIATKHGKEKVLLPLLEEALDIAQCLLPTMDTDVFGTFSGEIDRVDDPLSTLRKKCLQAFELTGCDLALASEGSFGPHPGLFFVPADDEWLMLKDNKNSLEIIVRELSTDTNYGGGVFKSLDEVMDFAAKSLFPSHALIVRAGERDFRSIQKGIQDYILLKEAVERCLNAYGQVHVETDMRACYNPTRMEVIKKAGEKLIRKLSIHCPSCEIPGYDTVASASGLPCMLCGGPSASTLYHVSGCTQCGYFEYHYHPYGKSKEDPQFCPFCNP